jgi:hypothetical protein
MVGVFLGAVFGALFGYGATWWHDRQETKARRAVLLRALRAELSRYPPALPRFVQGISNHIDPIQVSAIAPLLESDVLDATRDGDILDSLLRLSGRIAELNEIGRVYNINFFLSGQYFAHWQAPLSYQAARQHWHQVYSSVYAAFIERRDKLLSLLPDQEPKTKKH